MQTDADPTDLLARAIQHTGSIVSRVRSGQATLPTPCRSWDVRALLTHVVADVLMFTATAGGGKSEQREPLISGDDWAGAYGEATSSLLGAWRREGVRGRTLSLRMGEVPAAWAIGQQVADLLVHGWDVARATGQAANLDPELAGYALGWAKENLRPDFRGEEASGKMFGQEVAVSEGAEAQDRLVGFFGRDPAWSADRDGARPTAGA
jgi:uncharacterized protein (TIGR03086 family)